SFAMTATAISGNGIDMTPSGGAFTPTLLSTGGGTPTYTTQAGYYRKFGSQATIYGRVSISSKGTLAAGNVTIGGIPFTNNASANLFSSCSIGYADGITLVADAFQVLARIDPGGSQVILGFARTGSTVTGVTVADISASFDFIFSCTYIVS